MMNLRLCFPSSSYFGCSAISCCGSKMRTGISGCLLFESPSYLRNHKGKWFFCSFPTSYLTTLFLKALLDCWFKGGAFPWACFHFVPVFWLVCIRLLGTVMHTYLLGVSVSLTQVETQSHGVAGTHGHPMFGFVRNTCSVFDSSVPILHFHQQCSVVPVHPFRF